MAEYSLDEDNRKKYAARAEEWKKSFVDGGSKDDLKMLSDIDSESELGTFKKRIIDDEGMEKAYYSA